MNEFTAKYGDQIQGVLSGFDRLVFRGSLRQILLKDFRAHIQRASKASLVEVRAGSRPNRSTAM